MPTFHHVPYRWQLEISNPQSDDVALLLYRSNLLGADLRITNYGGGNTSCKTLETDPITGEPVDVLWIKGSGGDLGTLRRDGLAGLYLQRLLNLERIYPGRAQEDRMPPLFNHCLFDLNSRAPSIDTPLHAFLPFKHIDHLHPDAAIAIAASKDGKQITADLFGGALGWVDWQRPGFDLGLQLRACLLEHPGIRGIMLGGHGLFTWGDTAYTCYLNSLETIEQCADYIEKMAGKTRPVFGGLKLPDLSEPERKQQAGALAPILRGLCSADQAFMVGHFTDDPRVLAFAGSRDLDRLAPMGTSCPDHFLRTKISPLVVRLPPDADLQDAAAVREQLSPQFEAYRQLYADYYNACKRPDSPPMRDPNPVVLLYPGVGMFTFAKDKTTARSAAEFYLNAINVMRGAEAISSYTALPRQEAFDIEYWLLEEAKLQRLPKPKALHGRVALVTGSAGGIGRAVAEKFLEAGACVVISDNDPNRLDRAMAELQPSWSADRLLALPLDVTDAKAVQKAVHAVCLAFGGLDIAVNSAGLSISKPLEAHTEQDWDLLYNVLVKGQFLITQAAAAVMRRQDCGGDILNIVSKNALVAGPNNAAYGAAKAAQLHLSRLNAAELGADKIRVNTINPDAVILGSKIWEGAWAEGRAKAYGISVEELPAYYAKRNLLQAAIHPEDIANACLAFVGGLLSKSTGNVLNVDGGVAAAFVR